MWTLIIPNQFKTLAILVFHNLWFCLYFSKKPVSNLRAVRKQGETDLMEKYRFILLNL